MKKRHISVVILLFAMLMLIGCGSKESIILLPEDADLSMAPNVIVEPDKAPYNLGGWTNDNVVSWKVEIPQKGDYQFNIEYSRPAQYPETTGVIQIEDGEGELYTLRFYTDATGKDENDWSVYIVDSYCSAVLNAGSAKISVYEEEIDGVKMPDHFINLRGITIVGRD